MSDRCTRTSWILLSLLGSLLLSGWGCVRVGADAPAPREGEGASTELEVQRGDFRERYLLTGELQATESHGVTVPRSKSWQVQIRWMEEEGTRVEAGQKILELDNSAVTTDLEDKKLQAVEAENELTRVRADADAAIEEKRFALEQKQAELEKAEIEAAVPEEILPRREYQERQLAVERARLELAKAKDDLASTREAQEAEVRIKAVELERARREIETADRAIQALAVDAPADGVLMIEEHPRERRKFQIGDNVWVGFTLMRIPDLSSLGVEAVLSDVDEGRVEPGMAVTVTPDAFPAMELTGRVEEVSPVAREIEGSSLLRYFAVRISLDDQTEIDSERLRPGMSVKVEVLGPVREDVLLAPRAAVDVSGETPRVTMADGDVRDVELGPCNPTHCVIEEGLSAGQRLAHRGAQRSNASGEPS